ncbi:MAG: hypothetical protein ACR2I0_14875, partial [Rhodoferax sp.]
AMAGMDQASKILYADFSRDQPLKNADFSTPFRAGSNKLPLGEHPLLVTEIALTSLDSGLLQMQLCEQLGGQSIGRSCLMGLSTQMMHGLMHLLEKTMARSGWNVAATEFAQQSADSAAERSEDESRPRYLN